MPKTLEEFNAAIDSVHDSIVKDVKLFYEMQNHAIFLGKKIGRFIADIIAIRDETLITAIEVKTSNVSEIRKGVGQASSYLEWVHEVFLAVPPEAIELAKQLLKYSPIGIMTVFSNQISIVKESKRNEPDPLKLCHVLNNTVGSCWLCGRTFNVVRPSVKERDTIFITDKESEPELFKALETIKGRSTRTKSIHISICTVCSRIMGEVINEYLSRILVEEFPEEYKIFDFEELNIKEVRKLLLNRKK